MSNKKKYDFNKSSKKAIKEYKKSVMTDMGITWWQKTPVIIGLTVFLSCMDAISMYMIFSESINENPILLFMCTFGIALVLNFIPLIMGKLYKEYYYGLNGVKKLHLVFLAVSFGVIYLSTFWIRMVEKDSLISSSSTIVSKYADVQNVNQNEAIALAVILGLSPLITSVINFFLGSLSSDSIKNRIIDKKIRIFEYEYKLAYLNACLIEVDNINLDSVNKLDIERKNAREKMLIYEENELKLHARNILAGELKDPFIVDSIIQDEFEVVQKTEF